MKVYVDSSCDLTGEKQLNLRLSQQRAATVTAYLEKHGIASDRLIPRGFGATHFVAKNDTSDGRLQNRRVELVPIE
jgi:OOP family OmpA-OmpF porin